MKAFQYVLFPLNGQWHELGKHHIPTLNGVPCRKFYISPYRYNKIMKKVRMSIECTTLERNMTNDSPLYEGEIIIYNRKST